MHILQGNMHYIRYISWRIHSKHLNSSFLFFSLHSFNPLERQPFSLSPSFPPPPLSLLSVHSRSFKIYSFNGHKFLCQLFPGDLFPGDLHRISHPMHKFRGWACIHMSAFYPANYFALVEMWRKRERERKALFLYISLPLYLSAFQHTHSHTHTIIQSNTGELCECTETMSPSLSLSCITKYMQTVSVCACVCVSSCIAQMPTWSRIMGFLISSKRASKQASRARRRPRGMKMVMMWWNMEHGGMG